MKAGAPTTYAFHHELEQTPLVVQIQFSPDDSFDDVHIVEWSYNSAKGHGPVSIRADRQAVYLEFTTGAIFGAWSASTAAWTTYQNGYFRVIAF